VIFCPALNRRDTHLEGRDVGSHQYANSGFTVAGAIVHDGRDASAACVVDKFRWRKPGACATNRSAMDNPSARLANPQPAACNHQPAIRTPPRSVTQDPPAQRKTAPIPATSGLRERNRA